jgi:hypothetical protein
MTSLVMCGTFESSIALVNAVVIVYVAADRLKPVTIAATATVTTARVCAAQHLKVPNFRQHQD